VIITTFGPGVKHMVEANNTSGPSSSCMRGIMPARGFFATTRQVLAGLG